MDGPRGDSGSQLSSRLKEFNQRRAKFKLPSSDLYRYLQIKSYIIQHLDWDRIKLEPTNIRKAFINLVEKGGIMRKQVSLRYNNLLTDILDNTNHIKQQREMELNVTLEDQVF